MRTFLDEQQHGQNSIQNDNSITDEKDSSETEMIKNVKQELFGAIMLFQQEVNTLRTLLGDKAGEVPNAQLPVIFDDVNMIVDAKSNVKENKKSDEKNDPTPQKDTMTSDLLTIEHVTAQAELEIDQWKTEAQRWKGLLNNNQVQHNQEMAHLTTQMEKEFHQLFEKHVQEQVDKKLPSLVTELQVARHLLNQATSQFEALAEQKIITLLQLNTALEESRHYVKLLGKQTRM